MPSSSAGQRRPRGNITWLWRVGGVAAFDAVVEHDAVVVVDDLGLVAELDRPAGRALSLSTSGYFRRAPSGFVIVPALAWLLGLPVTAAIGTSLVILGVNSLAGLAAHLGRFSAGFRPILP